jgi:hypothetical protein
MAKWPHPTSKDNFNKRDKFLVEIVNIPTLIRGRHHKSYQCFHFHFYPCFQLSIKDKILMSGGAIITIF